MKQDRVFLVVAAIAVLLICCLCTLVALAIGGYVSLIRINAVETGYLEPISEPTITPQVLRPTEVYTPEAPRASLTETLEILQNTIVPENDPRDLALRLEGKANIPLTLPVGTVFQPGDQRDFWVSNTDTDENFQITATLEYATEHLYFWVENGTRFNRRDLEALAETFENQIYPTNRDFFGSEWSPGVDDDPHIYVLYARGLGETVAGYFSTDDAYHPLVFDYSNAHEMFMLNADVVDLYEEFTYGVLAHELQHMIHWNQDRNEDTWLDEGFSDLAMFLNGYTIGGHDYIFADEPDLQLNDWPSESGLTFPHYGASFLFTAYFLERFGDDLTQALVAQPSNGLVSVDEVLAENNVLDPLTGEPIGADDLFIDWVVTNYLNDPNVADGRYTYSNYPEAPQALETERLSSCPENWQTRSVNQYGADYLRITCRGTYTLQFEGSLESRVVPADPYSGRYAFWSNKGNESDMTLTRTFDFRQASGPLTLQYWTWFDIEKNWDYVYLVASTDGESWEILRTPSGTSLDPNSRSYGWGYSGGSGEWVEETVDLSRFAGQEVTIRFEYITDAGVNGEGLLLDDVAVPEIGYFTDFEADDGGWEAAGFARIQNALPQTYRLALITFGDEITVEHISLTDDNSASLPIQIGGPVDEVVLVVTGTTRFVREPTGYRFAISP